MKKIVVLLFVLGLVASSVYSQEGNTTPTSASEITFKSVEHDFGMLPYEGDGTCEFIFKNTGKEPLILTNVKSSCGCTIPTWPREPIGVKEEASIKVKYDTKRQGKFHKTITVFSNATNSPIQLSILGEVEQPSAEILEKQRIEREKMAEQRKNQINAKPVQNNANVPLQKEKSLPEVK